MIANQKSQIIMEFTVLYALILVVTIIFIESVNQHRDLYKTRDSLMAEDIGLKIQNEIGLTSFAEDGYSRQFELPQKIGNRDYNISLVNNTLTIKTNSTSFIVRVLNITGDIEKGANTITKSNGAVKIN